MRELVLFLAKSLVDQPDAVQVMETEGPEAIILELSVAPEDMGKVIGKQGRIAKAIRTVVKAATDKNAKPVFVEIQETCQTEGRQNNAVPGWRQSRHPAIESQLKQFFDGMHQFPVKWHFRPNRPKTHILRPEIDIGSKFHLLLGGVHAAACGFIIEGPAGPVAFGWRQKTQGRNFTGTVYNCAFSSHFFVL